MTDKELRKLSRLELLELLLEASRENEKLKEKVEKLRVENQMAQSIENLSDAALQLENALKYADSLTGALKSAADEDVKNNPEIKGPEYDRELYRRILSFFAKNEDKLTVFPSGIGNDVRARINTILENKNTK